MPLQFKVPGWTIVNYESKVTITRDTAPEDRDGDGVFDGYRREFVSFGMNEDQIINRVMATIQFLQDHELREGFEVNGVRVFDPHDPDVTGLQQEWFIEQQSALRGY